MYPLVLIVNPSIPIRESWIVLHVSFYLFYTFLSTCFTRFFLLVLHLHCWVYCVHIKRCTLFYKLHNLYIAYTHFTIHMYTGVIQKWNWTIRWHPVTLHFIGVNQKWNKFSAWPLISRWLNRNKGWIVNWMLCNNSRKWNYWS